MNPNPTGQVMREITQERANQDARWGIQDHKPEVWLSILVEEVGEAAREIAEALAGNSPGIDHGPAYRAELIQVAAVAAAAIESFDRQVQGTHELLRRDFHSHYVDTSRDDFLAEVDSYSHAD